MLNYQVNLFCKQLFTIFTIQLKQHNMRNLSNSSKFTRKAILNITEAFSYKAKDKQFVVEISDIRDFTITSTIELINPATKVSRIFVWYKTDMDSSHEDIYGWNYRTEDGLELLIIND